MKKKPLTPGGAVEERQAVALHLCISVLMRKFRIEPGLLAGRAWLSGAAFPAIAASFASNLLAGDVGWLSGWAMPTSITAV